MVRIAHISDLHFGKKFDLGAWSTLRSDVVQFNPDIVIVAGDLVDHPSLWRLLAVKSELERLCEECAALLVLVPGNHDVAQCGNFRLWGRRWFARIIGNAMKDTVSTIEEKIGIQPFGLNAETNGISRRKVFTATRLILRKLRGTNNDWQPSVVVHKHIVLASINSNASRLLRDMAWKDLATGLIDKSQMDLLDQILQQVKIPCLLRVAVLHHHPLPIAFSGGLTAWRAPALILRNAGTMLHKFQQHRFDLVLHGHEHVYQLARLELPSATGTPYPLTVLGAASACLQTNQPAANSLSEIEVESNGRFSIRTRFYGVGGRFATHNSFSEPLPALLSRAFARARERHRVECKVRADTHSIDHFGNLWTSNRIEGLALHDGAQPCEGRPVPASIPAHGRLALETAKLDPESRDRGLKLLWRDGGNTICPLETATPEEGGTFWVQLPQPVAANAPPLSFEVHRGSSNCINMSRWEAQQRQPTVPAGVRWDEEFVGAYVRFPTARLTLKLQLPDDLVITPRVQCRRHVDYPGYEIVDAFDAAMPPRLDQFVVDEVLQRETSRCLAYDAGKRTWCLDVERPLVGYAYELHWQVPGRDAEYEVAARAEFHRTKLSAVVHARGNSVLTGKTETPKAFQALAEGLANQFRSSNPPDPDERQIVMWMTYDKSSSGLQLRPVLEHRSWPNDATPEFVVPLGQGVAGAAFLQRRTIVWGQSGDAEPLIKPVRHPLLEDVRYAMALPIFLQDPPVDDRKPVVHTSAGAVIGVVSIHSNSIISGIAKLLRDDPEIREEVEKLQVVVQAPGQAVLEELHQMR